MPGLFAAGGALGPDTSLQRMRIRAKATAALQQQEANVAIAEVTGQQPGAENVSTLGGVVESIGGDVAAIMGKGSSTSSSTAAPSPITPGVIVGGLVLAGGLAAFLAMRS